MAEDILSLHGSRMPVSQFYCLENCTRGWWPDVDKASSKLPLVEESPARLRLDRVAVGTAGVRTAVSVVLRCRPSSYSAP